MILFRIYTSVKSVKLLALWKKCAIGSGVITGVEFLSGCIVNMWMKLNVWDYSSLPGNILGQVCLLYSFLWGLLSIPIVYVSSKIQKKYL